MKFLVFFINFLLYLIILVVNVSYDNVFKYSVFGYVVVKFIGRYCFFGWFQYYQSCYYFSRDRLSWWQVLVLFNYNCLYMYL